jgi:hypothetical protein
VLEPVIELRTQLGQDRDDATTSRRLGVPNDDLVAGKVDVGDEEGEALDFEPQPRPAEEEDAEPLLLVHLSL